MTSIDEMLTCVGRELAMRRRCYPRWVKEGRMTEDQAQHEVSTMEHVEQALKILRNIEETMRLRTWAPF